MIFLRFYAIFVFNTFIMIIPFLACIKSHTRICLFFHVVSSPHLMEIENWIWGGTFCVTFLVPQKCLTLKMLEILKVLALQIIKNKKSLNISSLYFL